MKEAKLTSADAGCWLDSARGRYIGEEVQHIAHSYGWKAKILSCDHEFYDDAWDEAEEYLNDKIAPEDFYFSSIDGGDWGLWSIENED
tara:strand:- start:1897 stop:2160 length:264 start_codon:yes stop_codon:yes gene_type:complete